MRLAIPPSSLAPPNLGSAGGNVAARVARVPPLSERQSRVTQVLADATLAGLRTWGGHHGL